MLLKMKELRELVKKEKNTLQLIFHVIKLKSPLKEFV
jgi:hypothetical protein